MTTALSRLNLDRTFEPVHKGPAIRKLMVSCFRNYKNLKMELSRNPVVLTGHNGAGKTNLIEALSFLSPGRGLRRARLSDVDMQQIVSQKDCLDLTTKTHNCWAISAELELGIDKLVIGTGRDEKAAAIGSDKRVVRVNGYPVKSHSVLSEYLALSWLTPQMDRLFVDGVSQRRRFLDRLVFAFDSKHAGRVNAYTHAFRERGRLIKSGRADDAWYLALETKIAEMGVAIIAARCDLIARLAPIASLSFGPFPGVILTISGQVEDWLSSGSALEAEDRFKDELILTRKNRYPEVNSVPGPHRSELISFHSLKDIPANQCSTGEQKALLVAILLSHAKLRKIEFGDAPLMLLDEIAAHLDSERREALFNILGSLGSQVWMTGTDLSLFSSIKSQAQFFEICDGKLS